MLIRAPWGVVREGKMIKNVGVCVEDDKISAWGDADSFQKSDFDTCVDLSGCVLSPGWINAHTHLDYGFLKGKLSGRSFVGWIQEVVKAKAGVSESEIIESIESGAAEAFWSGTTTVLSVSSFPECIAKVDVGALQVVWAVEWIDARGSVSEDVLREAMDDWISRGRAGERWAISPHAPYSASRDLYAMCKRWVEEYGGLLTTHVGESEAEWTLFQKGQGAFAEWFLKRGNLIPDERCSPMRYLRGKGGLPRNTLCVHGNYMEEEDLDAMAAGGMAVVHCPRCHDYFGHRDFDWEAYRERGISVCIGTDSLASTPSLDLRGELRHLSKSGAGKKMKAIDLWRMVTVDAAGALGMKGSHGVIDRGAVADIVAFPLKDDEDPWSFIFEEKSRVEWIMVGGKIYKR